jgi:hypothetical protein
MLGIPTKERGISHGNRYIDWKPYSALESVTPWNSGWWGGERETSMASIAENELSILLASNAAVPILTIVEYDNFAECIFSVRWWWWTVVVVVKSAISVNPSDLSSR